MKKRTKNKMRSIIKLSFITLLLFNFSAQVSNAQSIRKSYREMTATEKAAYKNALNQLNNNSLSTTPTALNAAGKIITYNTLHQGPYQHHGYEPFFPWHREFLRLFEQELKGKNPKLVIPFWEWDADQNTSDPLYWANDANFLQPFNAQWGLGRFASPGSYPSTASVNQALGYADWASMWHSVENMHGSVHVATGSVMSNVSVSPEDPVFYLHHCYVDKLWQMWEDDDAITPHNTTFTFTNIAPWNFNPNTRTDQRAFKVWYAHKGKVVLNKYTSSGPENYNYTGIIQATSFTVPGAATNVCNFLSGTSIELKPGFSVAAGAVFNAKIDAVSSPTSFFNTREAEVEDAQGGDFAEATIETENLQIFPNPTTGQFYLMNISDVAANASVQVLDMVGKVIFESAGNNNLSAGLLIDLSGNTAGTYFVKTNINGKSVVKKVTLN